MGISKEMCAQKHDLDAFGYMIAFKEKHGYLVMVEL